MFLAACNVGSEIYLSGEPTLERRIQEHRFIYVKEKMVRF